ncbi:MAG TPA: NINE protein [Flavobacteriales bacterium]|nr:NINE protein [Flavobacteriales bacterium]
MAANIQKFWFNKIYLPCIKQLTLKALILFLLLISTCISNKCKASDCILTGDSLLVKTPTVTTDSLIRQKTAPVNQKVKPKRRLVAAFLCVTLGPFGMHRLYLGTKPRVAAAYTLTLGGGLGLIPVIDLFHIVFSKDISRFKDNDQFIMWAK